MEPTSWRPWLVFALLIGYFLLFGMIVGAQGVLWNDVVNALGLSKTTFGAAQLVSPLVSVFVLLGGGQLSAWAGKKRLAVVALLLLSGSVLTLAGAGSLIGLLGALLLSGAGAGILEIAMNGGTLDWEHATGRPVMNLMHAGWSGGAVAGAFIAGSLLQTGWQYRAILVLFAVLCGLAILLTVPVRYAPTAPGGADMSDPRATLRLVFGSWKLASLALLGMLGIVGEAVVLVWGVIYLRELGAPAFVGGAAFAAFNGAMAGGRVANGGFVARYGSRASLFLSGLGLVLAMLLLIPAGSVAFVVAAFILTGLGVAGVVPTVLSIASRLAPGNSGAVAGGIMASAYAGFMICSPLIGWMADTLSLQLALLLPTGLSGLAILWLARGVEREGPE